MDSCTSDPTSAAAADTSCAAGEEEVDIISVSDKENVREKKKEEEEEDDSMKISSKSESELKSFEDQESSESDKEEEEGKTVNRIYENLPPNFPVRFTKLIPEPESMRPRILMERKLKKTGGEGDRLTIPARKMKEAFLAPEEEERLRSGAFMDVKLVERDGLTVSTLKLRRRRRRRSYVLTGGWKDVVERNRDALKRRRFVRVWYFRVDGLLWFALQIVEGKKKDCEIEKQITRKWYAQNNFGP